MKRVSIRPPRLEDKPALIAANIESRDFHCGWAEPFTDEAGFHAWFDRLGTERYFGFVVLEANSNDIAGTISLNEIVRGSFQCAFLGYYSTVRFAGKGFMTEAMLSVIEFAFNDLALHRLEANIQPTNTRSIALVKRLGFTLEGYSPRYLRVDNKWCDHERWALLNERSI